MTEHDAVLAVGLHRFAVRCTQRRQRVTLRAAEKVAAMARVIGVHAQHSPPELGFESDLTWAEDAMWAAMRTVEQSGNLGLLHQLDTLLMDLSVADLEAYAGADPAARPSAR